MLKNILEPCLLNHLYSPKLLYYFTKDIAIYSNKIKKNYPSMFMHFNGANKILKWAGEIVAKRC